MNISVVLNDRRTIYGMAPRTSGAHVDLDHARFSTMSQVTSSWSSLKARVG